MRSVSASERRPCARTRPLRAGIDQLLHPRVLADDHRHAARERLGGSVGEAVLVGRVHVQTRARAGAAAGRLARSAMRGSPARPLRGSGASPRVPQPPTSTSRRSRVRQAPERVDAAAARPWHGGCRRTRRRRSSLCGRAGGRVAGGGGQGEVRQQRARRSPPRGTSRGRSGRPRRCGPRARTRARLRLSRCVTHGRSIGYWR